MLRLICSTVAILFLPCTSIAQPAMTEPEAYSLLKEWVNRKQCWSLPISPNTPYRLDPANRAMNSIRDDIIKYERLGILKITIIESSSPGRTLSEIASMPVSPRVLLKAELTDSHPEYFCPVGGEVGVDAGTLALKEIIRLQKVGVRGEGGASADAYYVQATVEGNPTPLGLSLYPSMTREQKAQALFVYDFIKKQWKFSSGQVVNINDQFMKIVP